MAFQDPTYRAAVVDLLGRIGPVGALELGDVVDDVDQTWPRAGRRRG